jgi:3-deoxy-D-manno-octulosonate 8-phosphate phosphatase (KDO 8-P phosphatase)
LAALDRINLLLLDVDGVLTDGSILIDAAGQELKRFNVKDGLAIKAAMRCGIRVGILSARSSPATEHRAAELGIDLIVQGAADKRSGLENLCRRAGVTPETVACVGDDLADLPVLEQVAYPIAVADGAAEVRRVARYVTQAAGGRGAVREAIEHLLDERGQWPAVVDGYRHPPA